MSWILEEIFEIDYRLKSNRVGEKVVMVKLIYWLVMSGDQAYCLNSNIWLI